MFFTFLLQMKKVNTLYPLRILLLFCLVLSLLYSCSSKSEKAKIDIDTVQMQDTVWMCMSETAKRFHASDTCGGIMSCGEDIRKYTREEAEYVGRTYCHKCYKK